MHGAFSEIGMIFRVIWSELGIAGWVSETIYGFDKLWLCLLRGQAHQDLGRYLFVAWGFGVLAKSQEPGPQHVHVGDLSLPYK